MPKKFENAFDSPQFKCELEQHDHGLGDFQCWLFEGLMIYHEARKHLISNEVTQSVRDSSAGKSALRLQQACYCARFAGAKLTSDVKDEAITHLLVGSERSMLKTLMENFAK